VVFTTTPAALVCKIFTKPKESVTMTGSDLAKMFEFSYMAMNRNIEGVSHEESLVVPQPCGGNCLNWVFGHAVAARNMVLMLAGGGPAMTGTKLIWIWRRCAATSMTRSGS
jgi:NaMN:DMB phosphoribosyltransferase